MTSFIVCLLYGVGLLGCAVGLYNRHYNANVLQRVALALLAVWFVARVLAVFHFGGTYGHEPVIALALAILAIGTLTKTLHHNRHGQSH